jgi:hypothetical protein
MPVYNRPDYLKYTLQALKISNTTIFDIIFILFDDGSENIKTLELLSQVKSNPGDIGFKSFYKPLHLEPDAATKLALNNVEELLSLGHDITQMFSLYKKIDPKSIDRIIEEQRGKLDEKYNELKRWVCEYERFKKLQYNCKLRRNEGYMINASLGGMRTDIKMLIKKSLSLNPENKDLLPLFYEKEIFPYCRNININDEYFNEFYKSDSNSKLSGVLLKIMSGTEDREFGINMETINFVIFTVINLTDNGKVNNPPNPPYINVNNLIYYSQIEINDEELKKALKDILLKTKKYNFYNNNDNLKKVFSSIGGFDNFEIFIDQSNYNNLIEITKELLLIIQSNNPSTLIGSLESTDILQNTIYNKVTCSYNETLNYNLNLIHGFQQNEWINNNKTIQQVNEILDDESKSN